MLRLKRGETQTSPGETLASLCSRRLMMCVKKKQKKSPYPPGGVEEKPPASRRQATPIDAAAFSRFRLKLKQELCDGMPLGKQ